MENNSRFLAIKSNFNKINIKEKSKYGKISEFFAEDVFTYAKMKNYLPSETYKNLMKSIDTGSVINTDIADQVANSMKEWAINKGVTHFTHWFQPLTGSTAEKHDSFFKQTENGTGIENFKGELLIQQEPDASSFPSGGIRNTFEARGYTAWDPSSPAFVIDNTLCIPTIYISYNGESLDNKTPLLKSIHKLDEVATRIYQKYFDKNVKKINVTLGWEQEYFLVDRALFNARPDLQLTGRTLFGHIPPKGQQLEDHYFGSINERAKNFMIDFEYKSLRVGIPVTTRHNEVAPCQFEVAPMFEEVNLAVDHNLLLMDIMKNTAKAHNLEVLFHEKPFSSLNGSGKHNNWSMSTDTGVNILQPGNKPKSNLRFICFFANVIKAIHDYEELLRISITSAGNDYRLGANEAPPAIISAFIGDTLSKYLDEIEKSGNLNNITTEEKTSLKLKIGKIPNILQDNTDRNRTSPFAFTGNKFEFRAVGSTANCGVPMTTLNAIVTKQLIEFEKNVESKIENGTKQDIAILSEIQDIIKKSKKIRFEGDGYSSEWESEALKRGLSNLKTTPEALSRMTDKRYVDLFQELEIFTPVEYEARKHVLLDNYILKVQIEARVLEDIAKTYIIPSVIQYNNILLKNVLKMKKVFGDSECEKLSESTLQIITKLSNYQNNLLKEIENMNNSRKIANNQPDIEKRAFQYMENVKSYFKEIERNINKIEILLDDSMWKLPKLRELLNL